MDSMSDCDIRLVFILPKSLIGTLMYSISLNCNRVPDFCCFRIGGRGGDCCIYECNINVAKLNLFIADFKQQNLHGLGSCQFVKNKEYSDKEGSYGYIKV